jgi:hypothetical protein
MVSRLLITAFSSGLSRGLHLPPLSWPAWIRVWASPSAERGAAGATVEPGVAAE